MELREHAPALQMQKSAWRPLCRGHCALGFEEEDRVREEEELRGEEVEGEEEEKREEEEEELDAG